MVDKNYVDKEKERIKLEEEKNNMMGSYIPPEILAQVSFAHFYQKFKLKSQTNNFNFS